MILTAVHTKVVNEIYPVFLQKYSTPTENIYIKLINTDMVNEGVK